MCTFVGHTLFGSVVGLNRTRFLGEKWWMIAIWLFLLANLPDIDLLFGYMVGRPTEYHHLWTHSLTFVFLVGLLFGFGTWKLKGQDGFKAGLTASMIVGSHVVADFLALDRGELKGIQLFWPMSTNYYISKWIVFQDVVKASTSRAFVGSLFCRHNLNTVLTEIVILGPILLCMIIWHLKMDKKQFSHESKK